MTPSWFGPERGIAAEGIGTSLARVRPLRPVCLLVVRQLLLINGSNLSIRDSQVVGTDRPCGRDTTLNISTAPSWCISSCLWPSVVASTKPMPAQ